MPKVMLKGSTYLREEQNRSEGPNIDAAGADDNDDD
jgi:hypothetical protein